MSGNSLTVEGNEISDNTAEEYIEYGGGGGVYLAGSSPLLDNEILDNMTNACGGGVYVLNGAPDIEGNTVEGNVCADDGAGMFLYMSQASVVGNTFEDNDSWDDAGGLRIFISAAWIQGNEFIGNTANDDGGAVKFSHYHSDFVDNVLIGNSTGDAGGGLELDNDTSYVAGCTFENNHAARGAALHSANNETTMTIEDSWFEGNDASGCGGAIQLEDDPYTATVSCSTFLDNQAGSGGAICAQNATVDLTNLLLVGNTAATGGGLYLDTVSGTATHLTLDGNGAGSGAGITMVDPSALGVTQSIISNGLSGVGVSTDATPASWLHNDVYGNAGGGFSGMTDPTGSQGNIAADPAYDDPGALDYHLDPSSPCVDAGIPGQQDWDGTPADMGAYGGAYGGW